MKGFIFSVLFFISFIGMSQEYNNNCLLCAEVNGYYCGDDSSNWTQYSPNGCVPNYYISDGWEDCVDASDEGPDVLPTTIIDCAIEAIQCDTVYVTEYETIFDTIVNTEFIYEIIVDTLEVEVLVPEYIYVTDTVTIYEDILDTLYVDVIQEVEVVVYDTIVEVEYVEFIEYITEYIDCETGMPCNSSINELINKSEKNNILYNINGQAIREPNGLYIQNGKIKWHK
tara:strand:- start:66 stop:746 length:681 start_codon:yes stop_codon:yes gene_type:complete